MSNKYTIIDPSVIHRSMMGNSDMIKQFIELYLTQCPVDFENLEQSVAQKNKSEIASHAHHIKPTMEYIGASRLREEFQQLEDLAKDGQDIQEITAMFNLIKPQFKQMLNELYRFHNP